ncbi:MAG: cytochrome c3 family protein [Spirochaetes bacterium]|nr:cytochrome c3 family protein [Spirochaetota bacterium]
MVMAQSGCSEVKKSGLDEINMTTLSGVCMAFNCHNGTELRIFPPISGGHLTHLDSAKIGFKLNCASCHNRYKNSQGGLHKNGFINGYNWLYGTKTPGEIVLFGVDLTAANPTIAFNHAAGTCSGTGSACHGAAAPGWYSGSACASCHLDPPLSKYPPASGAHAIHRYKNYSCQTCHYSYAADDSLHNNTIVNGYIWQTRTSVGGDIVIFSAIAGTTASFDHDTGNCAGISCHGIKNWYGYTAGCAVCHRYPPLNQSTPTGGRHGTHLSEEISCQTCHYNYPLSDPLHNDGYVNGSIMDPRATVFGDVVNFSVTGVWNTDTQNCSGLPGGPCHGSENWYSGDD